MPSPSGPARATGRRQIRRRGRPNLPDEVARRRRVVTFVTEREKEKLDKLSKDLALSLSALCHRLISHGLVREAEKIANKEEE